MSDQPHLEPLPVAGAADYHVHCDYSVDAEGSIDDYCQAALQRNLSEICFTTHYDSNPNTGSGEVHVNSIRVNGIARPVHPDLLAPYVDDVHRAQETYLPGGLSVKLGIEYGWYPGCEESVVRLKERYPFDYVLCGIHELEDICLCCQGSYERCFARYSAQEMAARYYEQVITAIRSNLFDAIAHLDYYKKYGERVYGAVVHELYGPYLADVAAALKDTGTVLEINTSALRKGLDDYFPSVKVINEARRLGATVDRLGSDAHTPKDVGFDFEAATALAPPYVAGFDECITLD